MSAALLPWTAGCGPIAAGIFLGTASSSGQAVAPNTAPGVAIGTVASSASGTIDLPLVVKDAESNAVNLVVEVSIAGGPFEPASLVSGARAPTAVATSPAGLPFTFKWDSRKDTGPRDVRGVRVRITPYDANQGSSATATVDVLNNEAPVARILTLSWDPGTGNGFVFYSLSDSGADRASVKVELSLDGGATYRPATRSTGASGDGTTDLEASVSGSVHTFAWDSRTDAPGVRSGNVWFRLTPSDGLAGVAVAQGGLAIDNSVPPSIGNVSTSVSGNVVTVTYTTTDVVGNPVSVAVAFSADGHSFAPATGVAALLPDTSLAGQASNASGVAHQLQWNATQAGLGTHVVTIQLTPTSTVTGAAVASPPFPITVSGNGPPSGSIALVPRQDGSSATVPLTLTAQDPQGSNVSVVGSFSVNGGVVHAATFTGATTGLSTAAISSVHVLDWNAQADLSAHGYAGPVAQNVVVAVVLNNGVQNGLPVQTNAFVYGNAPPVVSGASVPGPTVAGVVPVAYTLADATGDATAVAVEWRLAADPDVDASYRAISVSGNAPTSLVTSPAGTAQTVFWNTLATVPGGLALTNQSVVLRLTPSDGLFNGTGPKVEVGPFLVTNNQPPVATLQQIPRQPKGAATQIPFFLYNAEGTGNLATDPDPITVEVEYSLDGGPWTAATGLITSGSFTASPGGVGPQAIGWASAGDLGLATVSSNVLVRITPRDSFQAGAPGLSAAFTVGDASPVISLDTVASPQNGKVAFDFTLADSTADPTTVDLVVTIGGTTTISSVTTVKPTLSPSGAGLASGFPGSPVRQRLVWDAPTDFAALGKTINNDAIDVQAIVHDAYGAATVVATLPTFTLASAGVGRPSGTIAFLPRQTGSAAVSLTLTTLDPQNLNVAVAGSFTVNGGSSYAATFQPPTAGLANGTHALVWNALADLAAHGLPTAGTSVVQSVSLTLVLDNGSVTSLPVPTNAFTFGNDAPVLSAVTLNGQAAPTTSASGVVPLGFLLSDSTADPSNVTVEWKLDGASDASYRPISVSVGSLVSLATSAGGTGQTVGWNTLATGAGGIGLTNQVVVLRFTPDDGLPGGTGTPVVAPPLRVENNEPPVATVQAVTRVPLGQPLAIPFTVFNSEGNGNLATDPDKATALVDISADGGVTYQPATNLDTTGPFTSLPSGWPSQLHWTPTQVAVTTSRVVVRITPRDSVQTGAPGFSSLLTVGDDAPVASFDTVLSPQNGQVTFNFTLADSTADPCTVELVFTIDGTTTISSTTTVRPTLAPSGTGLLSGFPGSAVAQTIVWNAPADFASLGRTISNDTIATKAVVYDAYGAPIQTIDLPAFMLATGGASTPPPAVTPASIGLTLVKDVRGNGFLVAGGAVDVTWDAALAGNAPLALAGATIYADLSELGGSTNAQLAPSPTVANVWSLTYVATSTAPINTMTAHARVRAVSSTGQTGLFVTSAATVKIDTQNPTPTAGSFSLKLTIDTAPTNLINLNDTVTFSWSSAIAGVTSVVRVEADLIPFGAGKVDLFDDGTHGDAFAGDGTYTYVLSFPPGFFTHADYVPDWSLQITDGAGNVGPVVFAGNTIHLDTTTLAPTVTITLPGTAAVVASAVPVTYALRQNAGLPCDVTVEYDASGLGTFLLANTRRCTQASSLPGQADGVSGVSASQAGTTHVFLWNSTEDLPARTTAGVALRVRASAQGNVATSSPVTGLVVANGVAFTTQGYAAGPYPWFVALGDVDRDGALDLVATNTDSPADISCRLGNGTGTFKPAVYSLLGGIVNLQSIAVADVNLDGLLDAVVVCSGGVAVCHGRGDGTFAAPIYVGTGPNPQVVAIGDVNRDGKPDLVVCNVSNHTVAVLTQGPIDSFTLATCGTGLSPTWVALGDLNRDGWLDVVTANSGDGTVSVLLDNGDGTFPASRGIGYATYAAGGAPTSVAVGDLDDDGLPDLAVGNNSGASSRVVVLLNQGAGNFPVSGSSYVAGAAPAFVAIGDVNGDGRLDVVASNYASGADNAAVVLLGVGDGTFPSGGGIAFTNPNGASGFASTQVALGDVNRDGKLDLVVGSNSNGAIQVFLNGEVKRCDPGLAGASVLLNPNPGNATGAPVATTLGDFDENGKPDYAVLDGGAGATANKIAVYLGLGDGSFQQAPSVPSGAALPGTPTTLVAARVSGHLALVVGYSDLTQVTVFLGNGTGTFDNGTTLPLGNVVAALAVGDVDGNGKPDVVAVDGAQTATVLLGNVGGFTPFPTKFTTGSGCGSVVLVDLDNNGKPELVTGNSAGSVSVLANETTSTGTPAFGVHVELPLGSFGGTSNVPVFATAADVNGDGNQDVLTVNKASSCLSILPGTGGLTLGTQHDTATGTAPVGLAPGDLDGSGNVSLVVANATDATLSVLIGTGSLSTFGTKTPVPTCAGLVSVFLPDLNGDGKLDVLATTTTGSLPGVVQVTLGNGDGTFRCAPSYAAGGTPTCLVAADLNRDGKVDLVVANEFSNGGGQPSDLSVLLGRGDGTFQTQVRYSVPGNPSWVAAGDFNRDGRPDLAVANQTVQAASFLTGNGDGTFQASYNGPLTGVSPQGISVGDVNDDGKLDVVTSNAGSNTLSVFLGNGNGSFQPAITLNTNTSPFGSAIADLNGDGRPDVAVACQSGGVDVFMGNGDGTFQPSVAYSAGLRCESVSIADLNGDGKPDLVVSNLNSNDVSVLRGKGDGTFFPAVNVAAGGGPFSVAIGDLNADGFPDIVVADDSSVTVSVLYNRGDGTFQASPVSHFTGLNSISVVLTDLNGDGKLDVAVAVGAASKVSVILGR